MTEAAVTLSDSITSRAGSGPRGSRRSLLASCALAFVIAAGCFAILPQPFYRATATVGLDEAGSTMARVMANAAAGAVVSKPVISRAAKSLVGPDVAADAPGLFDRLGLILGLKAATSQAARLEASVAPSVRAVSGQVPGTIDISAASETAANAARLANAVAEAFTAEQDDVVLRQRRERDLDAAQRLERLKADAQAAREAFVRLGGTESDPGEARTNAAAQTAAAKTRVDAIRAIMAAGSPPLSDRRDVPQSVEMLQNAYLDLNNQLSKARETLGDRHMTIVSLKQSVRRARDELSAEWKRLYQLAEKEYGKARLQEQNLGSSLMPVDAVRRNAYEAAKRRVAVADSLVARAEAGPQSEAPDQSGFRVLLRAYPPAEASGLSFVARVLLSLLSGIAMFLLARTGLRFRARADAVRVVPPAPEPSILETAVAEVQEAPAEMVPPIAASSTPVAKAEEASMGDEDVTQPERDPNLEGAGLRSVALQRGPSRALRNEMRRLLSSLKTMEPRYGEVPTLMVAANSAGIETAAPAMALATAAHESGLRVLVIEAEKSHPELVGAAESEAEPLLVDAFGTLRVAMRAEGCGENVYLAPMLPNGRVLAATLARRPETPIVDDIGSEYDLIIIDGGRVLDCAAEGWGADAYLRVGRVTALRDDEKFIDMADMEEEQFLGTLVGSRVYPKRAVRRSEPASGEPEEAEAIAPEVAVAESTRRGAGAGIWPPERRRVAAR